MVHYRDSNPSRLTMSVNVNVIFESSNKYYYIGDDIMADYSTNKKRQWRIIIKQRAIEALGGCCANCGVKFNKPAMYDIHHINFEKEFNISSIQTNGAKTWLKIRDELKKCCLLCPNCHRAFHCGEIDILFKDNYFNEEYYEWDMADYKQIKILSENKLIPIDNNKRSSICPKCGGNKSYDGQICRSCLAKKQWRCEHPSKEKMIELIKCNSIVQIGKMYGVSDNSIRNWLQGYNLPYTLKDIKEYNRQHR